MAGNATDRGEKKPQPGKDQFITLTFVIGGEPTHVEANVHQPLHVSAREALRESGNVGRPFEDYQATNESGQPLDLKSKIEELGLKSGATIFLNTDVGQGG